MWTNIIAFLKSASTWFNLGISYLEDPEKIKTLISENKILAYILGGIIIIIALLYAYALTRDVICAYNSEAATSSEYSILENECIFTKE